MFTILVAERGADDRPTFSRTVELSRVPVVGDRLFDGDGNGYEVLAVYLCDGGDPDAMVLARKAHDGDDGFGGVQIPPELSDRWRGRKGL